MNAFSADWLRLREPHDHAARAAASAHFDLARRAQRWREASGRPLLEVMDLACGSGANLRELAPRLGGSQRWRMVDHDNDLLHALGPALADWAGAQGHRYEERDFGVLAVSGAGFNVEVVRQRNDLAADLEGVDLRRTQVLTASALLDLVSSAWLDQLARWVADVPGALLFALNVDGRTQWSPPDPDDDRVHALFERDQGRDKGFGPALGGHAVAAARSAFERHGFRVEAAASDWVIEGGAAPAMLAAMIDGMAGAAIRHAPAPHDAIGGWQARRHALGPRTRLTVGHVDLLAER